MIHIASLHAEQLSLHAAHSLTVFSKKCRLDIANMIHSANSGHIGGAYSSVDIFSLLWTCKEQSDQVIVSHGHSAAAVYAVLGNAGYFPIEDAIKAFRRVKPYEGHPSIDVPGVCWCSGCLGQGLSVACGFALAKKLRREEGRVFVVMGDGEQTKGQLQEAREFAMKFGLDNLVAVVDCNDLQASGSLHDVMPQAIAQKYQAAGWQVAYADGHNFTALHHALQRYDKPTVVLAHTTMGKGLAPIEGVFSYHGKVPGDTLYRAALGSFSLCVSEVTLLQQLPRIEAEAARPCEASPVNEPIQYPTEEATDCRTAMGNALASFAERNPTIPMAALDCDLAESVKLTAFGAARKGALIECGIAEQNAATVCAALAKAGILAVFGDFSVFNIDEVYSQLRMADINRAPFKLLSTHAGLDVGEDGKTHQCIDYISLLGNLFSCQLLLPADANQADQIMQYALGTDTPAAVVAGRSKLPIHTRKDGSACFGSDYHFCYGKADWLREGDDGCIVTFGTLSHEGVKAADLLAAQHRSIAVLNITAPFSLDTDKLREAAKTGLLLTLEDHHISTGLGSIVASFLAENSIVCKFLRAGVTHYGSSAAPDVLYRDQGLDAQSVAARISSQFT